MNTLCTAIERIDREAPNANGIFVQNRHGATVAGPFDTMSAAWRECDRREPEERAKLRAEIAATESAS